MSRSRAAALLAAAIAGCAHGGRPAAPAAAPVGATVAADLGARGEVIYQIPDGWKATSGEPDPPIPASIRFEPPAGRLILVVTPFWGPGDPARPMGPEVARALVEAARDRTLGGALEEELTVRPLEAPGLTGWYFAATDRELAQSKRVARPDEYRCLVQGAAVVGPLVLAFSLLDDGDSPARATALAVVRGATHRPAPAPAPAAPPSEPSGRSQVDPSRWAVRGAEPLELGLPGTAWSLLLDLPGWRVAEPLRRFDGSGVTVIGQRQEDGLLFSASVVLAAGRRGAWACRATDWPRIAGLEGVGESRLETTAAEARAWYTVRDDGRPTRHLSAWRYRDGACIHLHLSLPKAAPEVEATLERALAAARYAEAL